ncbi:cyclic nucleotide-binding domain-containing protein [Methylotenera mobilis]|uniref:Cyclic nucleotide-binding protein n=1 Tax=Methylotenera mobilis (strain JLW8 / ATCC BAA-1282 / DSM 17540) TaxID=583345 RepID=C6WUC0_METML|nr:cyclic nucleotide-binding domain-containing protein [Methylotenera mobilis]ACT47519.1 cyclic nucleotide-binding protein [Methylotenera mobilis JLW8]
MSHNPKLLDTSAQMTTAVLALLNTFEPLAKLSAGRKRELAGLCFVEKVSKGINPLRMNVSNAKQSVYLIKGELELRFVDGSKQMLRAKDTVARHPIVCDSTLVDCIAYTDVEILRIDNDLLDIMMTWDQLSTGDDVLKSVHKADDEKSSRTPVEWMRDTSVFSVSKLQSGVFSKVPVANIEAMFQRMERINTVAGQVIIQQGAAGDYYYLIESGTVLVTRADGVNAHPLLVAELQSGDAFGEEALVSDNKRNATVAMKTDGQLLRLNKHDFVALLKEPMLLHVSREVAEVKIADGAIWVDARLPSEYQYDHIDGAINLPLNEIRQKLLELDYRKSHVVYCQTGRRSSAAAFILAQNGFDVVVLKGGARANGL